MMKKKLHPIQQLRSFLENFVVFDANNYKELLVIFFRLAGIPALFLFCIYDFYKGKIFESIFDLLLLLVLIFLNSIIKRVKNRAMVFRFAIALFLANFLFIIYTNPDFSIAILWIFLLPIPTTFVFGAKEGSVWIFLIFLTSLAAGLLSEYHASISIDFLIRFATIYSLLSILAFIGEAVRSHVHSLLINKQEELETLNAILYEDSMRDTLTGLYNRAFLTGPLEMIVAQALRTKTPLSIIMFDLDNFKAVNDNCGHLVGDQVLTQLGKSVLSQLKRKSDFVIRYGGDEFLVVLPDTPLKNARLFAEIMQKNITKINIPNCIDELKASFGLAELLSMTNVFTGPSDDLIPLLISVADEDMYEQKKARQEESM